MGKQLGRPRKKESEKLRGYRYNLNLDRDLKDFMQTTSWAQQKSITQYINDLIRADKERCVTEQTMGEVANIVLKGIGEK